MKKFIEKLKKYAAAESCKTTEYWKMLINLHKYAYEGEFKKSLEKEIKSCLEFAEQNFIIVEEKKVIIQKIVKLEEKENVVD